jgi:hypothetical protein
MSVYQNKNLGIHDLLESAINPPSKRKVMINVLFFINNYDDI